MRLIINNHNIGNVMKNEKIDVYERPIYYLTRWVKWANAVKLPKLGYPERRISVIQEYECEESERIDYLIGMMPEALRPMLILTHLENWLNEDIAIKMKVSLATMKTHRNYAYMWIDGYIVCDTLFKSFNHELRHFK